MFVIPPDNGIKNRPDVKLLLQGEGADQSTVFFDRALGSSARSPIPGCGCGYFNGSAYLSASDSTDWSAMCGSAEWTMECCFYCTSYNAYPTLFCRAYGSSPYTGFVLGIQQTGYLGFAPNAITYSFFGNTIVALNKRHHVALVCRNISGIYTIKCYLDGIDQGFSCTTMLANYPASFLIGKRADSTSYNWTGYLSEVHISSVSRYSSNFTVPTTKFISDTYTKMLLHFDNLLPSNYTTITDYSASPKTIMNSGVIQINGSPITRVGDVKIISQELRHPYARSAAYFPGASKLSCADNVDLRLGNQNFVIEGWINQSQTISSPLICAKASSGALSYALAKYDATYMAFLWSTDGATWGQYVTFPWQPTIGKHQFIAISRSGNVLRFYAEGDKKGTDQACSATFLANAGAFDIGKYFTTSFSDFIGSMIDFRVSVGTDRGYTGTTIPVPTAPLPSDSYTKLLVRGDNITQPSTFKDMSPSPKTITATGSVQTVPLPPGLSSMYFDGTGDSLTAPASSDFNPGSGDCSIHFWACPTAFPTDYNSFFGIEDASGYPGMFANFRSDGRIRWCLRKASGGNADVFDISSTATVPVNAQCHLAFVKSINSYKVFLNGNLIISTTGLASMETVNAPFYVGGRSSGYGFTGYIRGFTFARRALWTRNFTPPTRAA